jgi:hypothetical protein
MEWAAENDWPDSYDEGRLIELELPNGTTVLGHIEGTELFPLEDANEVPMFIVVSDDGKSCPFEVHKRWRFVSPNAEDADGLQTDM